MVSLSNVLFGSGCVILVIMISTAMFYLGVAVWHL